MVIDGKSVADSLLTSLTERVSRLATEHNLKPGLAVVLVGEDPASQVYVRMKGKKTVSTGMNIFEHRLAEDIPQEELLTLVNQLNEDPAVHGILVQLPLPSHMDESAVIEAIAPEKDVDGFHVVNSGRLMAGVDGALVPCTPQGCVLLAKEHLGADLSGKHALGLCRKVG